MSFISVDDFKSLPTQSLQMLKASQLPVGNNFLNGTLSNVFAKESTQNTLKTLHTVKNKLDAIKDLKNVTKEKISSLNPLNLKNAISTLGGTEVTAALNAGQNMAFSTLSNVTGSAGEVLGTVTGSAQVISGKITMVKDVTMLCINKLTSYCVNKVSGAVTNITSNVVSFPMDVASKTAAVFSEEFNTQLKEEISGLFKDSEDKSKEESEKLKGFSISGFVKLAQNVVGVVNDKVSYYTGFITDKITYYVSYYGELGPDALAKYLDKNVQIATGYVGTFIDSKVQFIDEKRLKAINDISESVGKPMASEAVKLITKALNLKAQKVKDTIAKAKSKVAILKQKAIMLIKAKLGQ